MTKQYCIHCKRTVEPTEDGKCPDCGHQLGSGNNKYYLSEPCNGPTLRVDLKPGQKLLDRFTIKSCLGRGSFSTVYLAGDNMRSIEVALKVVAVASESVANRLKQEVDLHSMIDDYGHVVRVYDIHSAAYGGVVLLLVSMEYADGGSLRQWLRANRDNVQKRWSEGLSFFRQACCGVQSLHAGDIVHLDLKPENLLLVNGILKVADLGLSKCLHSIQMADDGCRPDDQDYLPPCTPAYAAPEQILAAHPDDIDHRADIHALGAILFEIHHYKCRPPFGGTYRQIRQHHLHYMPAPVIEDVEPHIARVIARCLQKNSAGRYSSVSELLDDLEGRTNTEVSQITEDSPQLQMAEKIDDLWQQVCRLVNTNDLNRAGKLCRQILSISSGHDNAKCMLEEIQDKFKQASQFYRTIENGIGRKSLDELLVLLAEAVQIYPDHPDGRLVQAQLLSITRQYEKAMYEGVQAVAEKHWQMAQASFRKARQLNPGLPSIAQLVESARDGQLCVRTTDNTPSGNRPLWVEIINHFIRGIRRLIGWSAR